MLALLLANKGTLCVEVVPKALLDFSRETMRSRFTAIIQKPIYTFNYERFSPITPEMYTRLLQARDRQAIVMTHPSAIKSLALKFLEFVHHLDKNSQIKVVSSAGLVQRALGPLYSTTFYYTPQNSTPLYSAPLHFPHFTLPQASRTRTGRSRSARLATARPSC